MKPDKVTEAVVEETTVVRHNSGAQNWTPHHIATVRTPEDQFIVVGTEGQLTRGTKVKLFEQGEAPYGRV